MSALLESTRETEPKPFVSLTLLNPQLDKNALTDKQAILDVRAKNEEGKTGESGISGNQ